MLSNNLSVLLVEDNYQIATQIVDFLTDKGLSVDYANAAKPALALMEEANFDLVILDLMLPDMDGYELCRVLKDKADKHLPILMLTARDDDFDKAPAGRLFRTDFLFLFDSEY